MSESEIADLLRRASLRVTGPRVAVLSALQQVPHADAATIATLARDRLGAVSTQAVYDTLRTLVDAKLARRIDLPDSPARYESHAWDDHHHMVCRVCGEISDVVAQPLELPTHADFQVDAVEVTFWGTCATCAARGATAGTSPAPQP